MFPVNDQSVEKFVRNSLPQSGWYLMFNKIDFPVYSGWFFQNLRTNFLCWKNPPPEKTVAHERQPFFFFLFFFWDCTVVNRNRNVSLFLWRTRSNSTSFKLKMYLIFQTILNLFFYWLLFFFVVFSTNRVCKY